MKNTDRIPASILEQPQSDQWNGRYWFHRFEELDRLYYEKHLFCGYSASQHRIYLMNWND